MIKLFNYDNYKLELNEYSILLLKEFADVFLHDKSPNKERAFKQFTYIYLMYDFRSPITNYDDEDKRKEALTQSGVTDKEISSEYIKKAIESYVKIQNSDPVLKMIKALYRSHNHIENFITEFNTKEKVKDARGGERFLYDVKDLLTINKQAKDLVMQIKELEELYRQQLQEENTTRGDASYSPRDAKYLGKHE